MLFSCTRMYIICTPMNLLMHMRVAVSLRQGLALSVILLLLQSNTARVLWSFHDTTDPTSEDIPSSLIHSHKGSVSLNLLGGLPSAPPDPEDLQFYDVTVDRVSYIVISGFFLHCCPNI